MGRKSTKSLIINNSPLIDFCGNIPNFYPKVLVDVSEGEIELSYFYKFFKNEKIVTEYYAKKISKAFKKLEVNVDYWQLMGWFLEKKD